MGSKSLNLGEKNNEETSDNFFNDVKQYAYEILKNEKIVNDKYEKFKKEHKIKATYRKLKIDISSKTYLGRFLATGTLYSDYSRKFLFRKTEHQSLYLYKKALYQRLSKDMLFIQPLALLISSGIYYICRKIKSRSFTTFIYFVIPYLLVMKAKFDDSLVSMFNVEYPPNNKICKARMDVISGVVYFNCKILMNELIFLCSKLKKENFIRKFTIGEKKYCIELKIEKENWSFNFLDGFENTFKLKQDVLLKYDISEILNPKEDQLHLEFVNNLLSILSELSTEYANTSSDKKFEEDLKEEARRRKLATQN